MNGEENTINNVKKIDISQTNKFNLTVIIIELISLMIGYGIQIVKGIYSTGYIASIILGSILVCGIICYVYFENKHSRNFKYAASIGFTVLYSYILLTSDNFLVFVYIIPSIIVSILYFDYRYIKTISIITVCINIADIIYRCVIAENLSLQANNIIIQLLIISITCYAVTSTSKLANLFNKQAGNVMADQKNKTENILKDVLKIGSSIRNNTSKINYIVEELKNSTNSVASAMENISLSNHSDSEDIQNQSIMTEKIHTSINETVQMSKEIVNIANSSSQAVVNGLNIVNNLKNQSGNIITANEELSSAMNDLQEKTKEVENIASIIFDISNQTNLLALNASIESARAGEAGKGFAVVANEIRELSDKTRESTENISKLIKELNSTAVYASEAVTNSISSTKEQNNLIADTESNFNDIDNKTKILTQNIGEIDNKISELLESNNTIVDSITRLSATSEEVTASADEATNLSEQNLSNVDFVKGLVDELETTSQLLDKYIKEEDDSKADK